jgi:hypothetical protein
MFFGRVLFVSCDAFICFSVVLKKSLRYGTTVSSEACVFAKPRFAAGVVSFNGSLAVYT